MNNSDFGEKDIICGLLKPENTSFELYSFLKSKGLVEKEGNKIILSKKGKEILEGIKEVVICILEGTKEENEDFIDITFDTKIYKLFFSDNEGVNKSVILGLQQCYNIQSVKDLLNINFSEQKTFLSKIKRFTNSNLFFTLIEAKKEKIREKIGLNN